MERHETRREQTWTPGGQERREPAHGLATGGAGTEAVGVLIQHFEQVLGHVLEHKVQLALAAEGLVQVDDVGLAQHAQDLDLTDRGLAHGFVVCGAAS